MAEWLVPAVAFAVIEGALGVTSKLALRSISWRQLVILTSGAYLLVGTILVLVTGHGVPLGAGAGWAALSGFLAAGGLLCLFFALERGEASRVIPVSAAYPLVTAVAAAVVLSEDVSPARAIGTVLVVIGIVELGRD